MSLQNARRMIGWMDLNNECSSHTNLTLRTKCSRDVLYLAVFTAFSQVGIMFQSLGQMSSRSEVHYKLFV